MKKTPVARVVLSLFALLLCAATPVSAQERPNIIIVLADDLGWGDVGFNGCREIPTPNLDALARSGVVFTSGYASHPYCSPSRAGLLTGRYAQRFGHEANPGVGPHDGLPLDQTLLSNVLKEHGYQTGIIGKWHLGDDPEFWPTRRGFDYWYGFSSGAMSYWGDTGQRDPMRGVLRNGQVVPKSEQTYLTDDFSREAVRFIESNRDKPFFLYLAYNAPHSPDHATRAALKKTEHIEYGGRAVYGAMVAAMDEGIGSVLGKLEELKLRERTLIFFYSDNGGRKEHAVNYPFRGHKGMLFEGGIRVPFCVSYPARIRGGRKFDHPIIALDIFPTALAAAGIPPPKTPDGLNLLPYLSGNKIAFPARALYWRYAGGDGVFGHAVRDGAYKLVSSVYKGKTLLFNLDADPYEQRDLAAERPDIVRKLTTQYQQWDKAMTPPRWLDDHGVHVRGEEAARQAALENASRGEKITRPKD